MKFSPIPGRLYFAENEKNKDKTILNAAKNHWKINNSKEFKAIIFFESKSTKIDHGYYYYKMKNKDWGGSNWKELILKLKDNYLIIQSKHVKSERYDGTYYSSIDFDFRIHFQYSEHISFPRAIFVFIMCNEGEESRKSPTNIQLQHIFMACSLVAASS